jgi:hypothetical protein
VKNRRTHLGLLAGTILFLAIAAAAIGASPSIRWRLVGSGGGPVQGTSYGLASAIGQAASGRVDNGYTIYSGLYLQSLSPGPSKYYALVPAVMDHPCPGMVSPVEVEPNDMATQANRYLCPNVVYSGSPNSHGSGRDDDWFAFYWSGQGTIVVDLDNFLTAGQLLLYRDPAAGYLTREYDQPDRHYTVTYSGVGQAGIYYIQVFAPSGHATNTGNYTLTYQLGSP